MKKNSMELDEKINQLNISKEQKEMLLFFFTNLHTIRRKLLKHPGGDKISTAEIADSVGLKLDQLWRIDTCMSGTLPMLVLLLAYYKEKGFSIDQLFSKAFSSDEADQKEIVEAFNQMDDLIN